MRYTRLVAVVLLAAYLPACATYSVMPNPAATLKPPQTEFQQVKITLRTGEEVTVRSPRVDGDSLWGTWPNSLVKSVALADVVAVQAKGVSTERTAGLILGIAALAALVGLWIWTFTAAS